MKKKLRNLVINFNITDMDFMGYIIEKNDKLSYHHITKKEHGGKETYDNGAVLLKYVSHPYLHIIEFKDLDMFIYINSILREVNNQGYLPNHEQLLKIFSCLESFEREHSADEFRNGTPLIKPEYTKRIIL